MLLSIWTVGFLDFWIAGFLDFWIFGLLDFLELILFFLVFAVRIIGNCAMRNYCWFFGSFRFSLKIHTAFYPIILIVIFVVIETGANSIATIIKVNSFCYVSKFIVPFRCIIS